MLVVMSVMVVTWIEAGRLASSCGRIALIRLTTSDGVGAGLALDVENDGGRLVHPRGLARVFHAVDDIGDISDEDRRAVAVGDDDVRVVLGVGDLVVGVDLVVLARAVEVALGGVDAGLQ